MPSVTESDFVIGDLPDSLTPLINVPFVLPRSSRTHCAPSYSSRQCFPDTKDDLTGMSQEAAEPMVQV